VADHLTVNGSIISGIKTPLTLTALQIFVGGFIRFVELSSGDLMVVNEASADGIGFYNPTASQLAGNAGPIYGDAVLCTPEEIE
jgi:hypothetical protein